MHTHSPRCTFVSFVILFGLLLSAVTATAAAEPKPNLVIIYTDDQGYGDASCLNPDSKFDTPNLDRLAREGMTFTDGHSSDTVCTPSRYGLLTGRYSWRTALKKGVYGADRDCLIEKGRMTIGSLLQAQGYQTAMVGKWHLGMQFDGSLGKRDWSKPFRQGPVDRGFDYFFGIPASMNYGVLTYLEGDRVLKPADLWTAKKPGLLKADPASYRITPPYQAEFFNGSKLGGPLEVAADFDDVDALRVFVEKSKAWLDEAVKPEPGDATKNTKPFFLYLPLTSPHKPVIPAPEFVGKSQCGAYGDFMVETDFRVGQMMDHLDTLGVADNTIIVFTSDNGPEKTYIKRIPNFDHRSSGIYRGGKRDLYEGGHRVPFLVRWPAKVKAGSTSDVPVSQTDLLATMAELLGTELPANAGEDSWSFAKILKGDTLERDVPLMHHSSAGLFAVRDGDWKLHLDKPKAPKLYNLAQDPSETDNLAGKHAKRVRELKAAATRLVQRGRSTPGAVQKNDVSWWKQLTWIPKPE